MFFCSDYEQFEPRWYRVFSGLFSIIGTKSQKTLSIFPPRKNDFNFEKTVSIFAPEETISIFCRAKTISIFKKRFSFLKNDFNFRAEETVWILSINKNTLHFRRARGYLILSKTDTMSRFISSSVNWYRGNSRLPGLCPVIELTRFWSRTFL